MTKKRSLLKKTLILTGLILILSLATSLMIENTTAATSAATSEPTTSPNPTSPLATSKFAYDAKGNQTSGLPAPKTVTLCNYTTPSDTGTITQISIYLTGIPEGSQVKAVIFPNDPDSNMPQVGDPVLQSDSLNVTSVSGKWYNFEINYSAFPNTVYWIGYYADDYTRYSFDVNNEHISLTSQIKDDNSNVFPILSWRYQGKAVMSLYAQYTIADPQHTPTATPPNSHSAISTIPPQAQSFQDTIFVLLLIGAESTIVVTCQRHKKRTSSLNNNSISTSTFKNPTK